MNIANWLTRTAVRSPDRPALFDGMQQVACYGEVEARSLQIAGWMRAQGVAPGDRVAVFMQNAPDYLIALFAVWAAGAIVVPINAKLHAKEVAWILENSEARLCLTHGALKASLEEIEGPWRLVDIEQDGFGAKALCHVTHRAGEDTAWLFYTSGTTGRPKGVEITHRNLLSMSLCYQSDVAAVRSDHATIYAAPMSHGAGLYSMMHVLQGARHVFPPSRGFDPTEVLSLARAHGRAHMFAAPTMVKRLTDYAEMSDECGEGLETVVYAGGPMYEADILKAVNRFGPVFAQIYGQGESPMGITALTKEEVADRHSRDWRLRLNSVGRAQSAVEVRICGADGQLLGPGEVGEIEVRGDTVMAGYWNAPEATASTLVDGWLRTGDMGRLDAQGYMTLMDRSKDVIISGGSNIYPREVENVLLQHAAVSEVSVIGDPHPEWGEQVVAFVVLRDGAICDSDALDRHCLNQIARFKRPKVYQFLDALPKNNYGKVLKTELRTLARSDVADPETALKSVP
ncbi:AMP-binding protein [Marivita hallyeonensis]|uniref:3-methylmercaptopropionyl-CoA ligase n=1 Tax=Marivita hallyeonensis TaxID=996342 RepID=A0A1M5Y175_9RHOB|nr:AMP-binding protein [Marivita hallyeonensis]SHI05273.1 long-chain acyl-CoA synthetase [Marivita hallyeonensis]